jgi:hypothetical protein
MYINRNRNNNNNNNKAIENNTGVSGSRGVGSVAIVSAANNDNMNDPALATVAKRLVNLYSILSLDKKSTAFG